MTSAGTDLKSVYADEPLPSHENLIRNQNKIGIYLSNPSLTIRKLQRVYNKPRVAEFPENTNIPPVYRIKSNGLISLMKKCLSTSNPGGLLELN